MKDEAVLQATEYKPAEQEQVRGSQLAAYEVGQVFWYRADNRFDKSERVTVVGIRERDHAKLSNGLVADCSGYVEGTRRSPGGRLMLDCGVCGRPMNSCTCDFGV